MLEWKSLWLASAIMFCYVSDGNVYQMLMYNPGFKKNTPKHKHDFEKKKQPKKTQLASNVKNAAMKDFTG